MTGNVKSQNQLGLKLYGKLAMLDISVCPFLLQLKKQIDVLLNYTMKKHTKKSHNIRKLMDDKDTFVAAPPPLPLLHWHSPPS